MATMPTTMSINIDVTERGWICSIHNVSINPRAKICKLCERENEKKQLQSTDTVKQYTKEQEQWLEYVKTIKDTLSSSYTDALRDTCIQVVSTSKEESGWASIVPTRDPSMQPTFSEYLLEQVNTELRKQPVNADIMRIGNCLDYYLTQYSANKGVCFDYYESFLNSKEQENVDTFADYLLLQALDVLEGFHNTIQSAVRAYFGKERNQEEKTILNRFEEDWKASIKATEDFLRGPIQYGQMVKLLPPHEYAGRTGTYIRDEVSAEGEGKVKMFSVLVAIPDVYKQVPALEGEYEPLRETEADGFSVTGAQVKE
jgi:hypothetical protein